MKLKMFFVFVLTFILLPCVGYADDFTFYYNENSLMDDSKWITLYKGICTSRGHKGVLGENASGCIYYWGEVASSTSTPTSPSPKPSMDPTVSSTNPSTNSSTVTDVTTKGFSDVEVPAGSNGCSGSGGTSIPGAAAQTEKVLPSTCKNGVPEKVELIGFDDINNLYNLLNNNLCSSLSCYRFVSINYCNNWESTEQICINLKEFDDSNSNIIGDPNIIGNDTGIDSCEKLLGTDTSAGKKLIELIRTIKNVIFILVPIIAIVFTTIDFTKAIFAGEDDMKKAQGKLFKRLLLAVVVFLIPLLIKVVLWIANFIWPSISTDLCGIL